MARTKTGQGPVEVTRPHGRRRIGLRYGIALSMVVAGIGMVAVPSGADQGDAPVTGAVYRDANGNGQRELSEGGQAGVTVTATDTTGAAVTTVSSSAGTYSLAVASLGAGPFRIEFSGWPANLHPAPHGAGDPTSVSVASAGAKVDFGVIDADDYCQANPDLVVSCFVSGASGGANLETVASFPYSAGATETSTHGTNVPLPAGGESPDETKIAELGQTGSIYGEGWHPRSSSLYLAAFTKKYVPFGPGGSGAIYVRHTTGAPTLFWNSGSSANRSVNGGNWYLDPWTDQVGKVGWGDIDVLGNRLYAVNLEDRQLYVFDLDPASGNLIGSGPVATVPIPAHAANPADSRPFGLGSRDGILYLGGVDSAQAGGTPSAWVIAFNPMTTTFEPTPVTQFPLDFGRGCAYVAKTIFSGSRCSAFDGNARWRNWNDNPSSIDAPDLVNGRVTRTQVNPQPQLSDIAFDDAGNMSLGFRDRFGDQSGRYIPGGTVPNPLSPTGTSPVYLTSYTFGDTLRLARSGAAAAWTLESNGTSGGVTGTASSGFGPGGGEFYDGDNSLYNVDHSGIPVLEGHDEVTMGALHHQPGTAEMTTTAYDVFGRWDTLGIRFMTDTGNDAPKGADSTDLNVRAYSLYTGTFGGVTPFGKANGLGDLEAMCDMAPLEIGNYVWFDADRDGIQDATEKPVPGVTVTLRTNGGAAATAVTDATGQYWFVSADAPNVPAAPGTSYGIVPGGVQPDTDYSITFDAATADTTGIGVAASDLIVTIAGQGTPTTNSKPTATGGGLPTATVHTGGAGANDHTFDAGYQLAQRPAISIVKSVNGDDANTAPGPTLPLGSTATFTYLVTNSGSVPLDDVGVTDDRIATVTCPKTTLVPGESMTCTATAAVVAGQYTNVGTATGTPTGGGDDVTASDSSNYIGQPAAVLEVTTTIVPTGGSASGSGNTPTGVEDTTDTADTATATSSLPSTGGDTRGFMLMGAGLIIAGAGLVLTTRRQSLRLIPIPVDRRR